MFPSLGWAPSSGGLCSRSEGRASLLVRMELSSLADSVLIALTEGGQIRHACEGPVRKRQRAAQKAGKQMTLISTRFVGAL